MNLDERPASDTQALLARVAQLQARVAELEQAALAQVEQPPPAAVIQAGPPPDTLPIATPEGLGRAVLLCSNDGFWHWDLLHGNFTTVRPSPMLGYTEQQDPRRDPIEVLHPDDREAVRRRMAIALRPGGVDFHEGVFRLQHQQGHYVPVLMRARIVRDATGKAVNVFGTNVDIALQLAQERALKAALAETDRQQRLLRATVDSIGQGLLVLDAEGRVTLFNARFCDLLQIDSDLLASRPSLDDLGDAQKQRGDFGKDDQLLPLKAQMHAVKGIDHRVPVHYTRKTLDGRFIEVQSYPSADGNYIRTYTDITALRLALETAEAATQAKSRFLASMSHELRTPLTAVLGLNQLLMASTLDAAQRELAGRVEEAGAFLLSLVNDILDFSKAESGHQVAKPSDIVLRSLLQEVHDLLNGLAQDKQLDFQVGIDPALPEQVVADPLRLKQVLVNLGSNAIKFTRQGHVRVQVSARPGLDGSLLMRFDVEDTGIGIAANDLARVFDRFSQVDDSADRRVSGTGLGLAISRQWVSLMGGELLVSSTPGVGSCFWFEVPVSGVTRDQGGSDALPATDSLPSSAARPTAAERQAPTWAEPVRGPGQVPGPAEGALPSGGASAVAPRPKRLQGLRVLAVDDNATNRMLVELFMAREGCSVDLCDSGPAALERLRLTPAAWDVVLMDMQMPLMDGLDTTRRIRSALGLQRLPVFGMTANVLESDRQACLDAGMNGHMPKPFDVNTMVATLSPWVKHGTVA